MKSKLRTAMSKMSVRDLGRLYLKDAVALLVDGTAAYTTDEFSSALSRMDDRRRSMCQFMEYRHAASQLCLLTVFSRWVSTAIHEGILRIEAMMGYVSLSGVSYAASQLMVIERLSLDIHDPWDSEVILKEHSADVKEAILARKADIAEACSDLNTLIRMHLTITQAMVSLAEMLQMPEIASIPNNPMEHVDRYNESLSELEETYREVFPEIDISILEPSQAEVDQWLANVAGCIQHIYQHDSVHWRKT